MTRQQCLQHRHWTRWNKLADMRPYLSMQVCYSKQAHQNLECSRWTGPRFSRTTWITTVFFCFSVYCWGTLKHSLKSHNTTQEYTNKTVKRTLCTLRYAPKLNSVPSIVKKLKIAHRLWRNGKSNNRDWENWDCTVVLSRLKVIFQLEFWV